MFPYSHVHDTQLSDTGKRRDQQQQQHGAGAPSKQQRQGHQSHVRQQHGMMPQPQLHRAPPVQARGQPSEAAGASHGLVRNKEHQRQVLGVWPQQQQQQQQQEQAQRMQAQRGRYIQQAAGRQSSYHMKQHAQLRPPLSSCFDAAAGTAGVASHRGPGVAGSRHGPRGSQQLPPPVLTAMLKQAGTPLQLAELVQQHAGDLNHIHLSAAFTRAKALRAEGMPLQQLPELLSQLRQLAQRLQQQCGTRGLANIIWSCSALSSRDTAAELLPVFLQSSNLPQAVSNVLWAAATLSLQPTDEQLQQLLQHFSSQQLLQQANPQNVANTLWAVATMQQQVPPGQLQQMLDQFQTVLQQANPQSIATTLWAVVTMQQQVPPQQLQQMLDRFQVLLPEAKPQNVSNTMLACAKLRFAPQQLLSALEQRPQQLQTFLAAANPHELSNTAWACGQLGYRGEQLPGALLQQAVRLLQSRGDAGGFNAQNLCNLCWPVAVLHSQECVPLVLQLAGAASQVWGSVVGEGVQQLYQVHLWLLDSGLPAPGQGLSGVLSQQQLEHCRASWEQQLAAETAASKTSDLQRDVFAAAQQLSPELWQEPPALEQVTADGALSVDIAATTATGVRVAIEADGPWHYMPQHNPFRRSPHAAQQLPRSPPLQPASAGGLAAKWAVCDASTSTVRLQSVL